MPKVKEIKDLQALGANILVEVEEEKKKTDIGIALPDSAQDKETVIFGKVVSIGTDYGIVNEKESLYPTDLRKLRLMGIRDGDMVVCKKFDYHKVKVGDESKEYRIYNIDSIIGTIKQ